VYCFVQLINPGDLGTDYRNVDVMLRHNHLADETMVAFLFSTTH